MSLYPVSYMKVQKALSTRLVCCVWMGSFDVTLHLTYLTKNVFQYTIPPFSSNLETWLSRLLFFCLLLEKFTKYCNVITIPQEMFRKIAVELCRSRFLRGKVKWRFILAERIFNKGFSNKALLLLRSKLKALFVSIFRLIKSSDSV